MRKLSSNKTFSFSEIHLKKMLSDGCHDAFEQIFHHYKGDLFLYSFKVLKSKAIADDVVQNTFVRLWKTRLTLEHVDNLKSYIFKITRNLIIDYLKEISRNKELKKEFAQRIQSSNLKLEEDYIYAEMSGIADEIIQALAPQRQAIYHMRIQEKCSYNEIAKRLNISENTVKVTISKTRKIIRKQLLDKQIIF